MGRKILVVFALLATGCTGSRTKLEMGGTVSLGKGEFSAPYVEARNVGPKTELVVFFRWTGPASDVMSGLLGAKMTMTLQDSEGTTYSPSRPAWSPIQPMPEEMYSHMRNYDSYRQSEGRDKSFEMEAKANADRFRQAEADLAAGRNPTRWVCIFKVPMDKHGFSLLVENPDRQSGQPGIVEIPLGR